MCNYKQYLDRQYTVSFFYENGRSDLAHLFEKISVLSQKMATLIPQDFSAVEMFSDKEKLKPYCDIILQIAELEKQAVDLM